MKTKKKKMKTLDRYILFSIIILIVYTIVQIVLSIVTKVELSTLTACFFAAFGGEIFACAMIKRLKLQNEQKIREPETQVEQEEEFG